jgi:hypothetical protein
MRVTGEFHFPYFTGTCPRNSDMIHSSVQAMSCPEPSSFYCCKRICYICFEKFFYGEDKDLSGRQDDRGPQSFSSPDLPDFQRFSKECPPSYFLPVTLAAMWGYTKGPTATFQVIKQAAQHCALKNAVFWDVTPYGSCKNRSLKVMYRLHLQGKKNRPARNNVTSNCQSKHAAKKSSVASYC